MKSVFALQTEKGANVKVELLNGQRKSVSYYSVELDKAEKRSKETNITVEMTTNVIDCIIPDTYASGLQSLISEEMWPEFIEDVLLKKGKEYLLKAFTGTYFKNIKMYDFSFKRPQYYNHSTDSIEFKVDLPKDFFKKYFAHLTDINELFDWCRNRYRSTNGYISQMPTTKEQFEKYLSEGPNQYSYNFERALGAIMSFEICNEIDVKLYQEQYMEEVSEYAYENGYVEDEYDID